MKPIALALILALPTIAVSACSRTPAVAVSHPPNADLTCPAEPDVTAALAADPTGLTFDMAVREMGDACRQSLARVCRWHKERGLVIACPPAIKP